ncbi:hypothetical protein SBOR_1414 [Sclerotinia borealis F-4128]|uniref:Uncharacterized protein n=1 Tax=Sclerotinia borealis (strain F-4128) TaxID=1432307 RepID=W9CQR1_SCLBF|nr:hypothetical protein SBOR_1414 [Sclerotinia borealis F-4128]
MSSPSSIRQAIHSPVTLSKRGKGNLLPLPSRIIRKPEPNSVLKFVPTGTKEHPRSKAEWAHYFRQKGRLVLTLDMGHEATDFRNTLKNKFLHPWGKFSDTRFDIVDPLPDRLFYLKLYKDAIDELCNNSSPLFNVGPSSNLSVQKDPRIGTAGLQQDDYQKKTSLQPPQVNHHLIVLSFAKGSAMHQLREHFLKTFGKLENEEIQLGMENLEKEKMKALIPLGFVKQMGFLNAETARNVIIQYFKGDGGIHLGHAVGLSLWRCHYDTLPARPWENPVMMSRTCLYSKQFEGIPKKQSKFFSIAPAELE